MGPVHLRLGPPSVVDLQPHEKDLSSIPLPLIGLISKAMFPFLSFTTFGLFAKLRQARGFLEPRSTLKVRQVLQSSFMPRRPPPGVLVDSFCSWLFLFLAPFICLGLQYTLSFLLL